MSEVEIQDILEELHLVRPEILSPKAKKLFEAIMDIADERDNLLKEVEKQNKKIAIKEEMLKIKDECVTELLEENQELRADYGTQAQVERDFYKSVIDELRSWLEEYYDYSDCMKIKSALDKLNELVKINDKSGKNVQ
jgi:hypothetical protein